MRFSVVAAVAAVAAFTGFAAPAQAGKPNIHVEIGFGGYDGFYGFHRRCIWDGPGYICWPRRFHHFYDDYDDYFVRVDCDDAYRILRHKGYRKIRVRHCGGRHHVFKAKWRGEWVIVRVSSHTGRVKRIYS